MSALHPRIRIPLWVAVTLPAAAYVYRSVRRDFDFGLDLPQDVIALAAFAVGFGAVAWSRRMAAKERDEQPNDKQTGEDGGARDERQDDEIVRDVE